MTSRMVLAPLCRATPVVLAGCVLLGFGGPAGRAQQPMKRPVGFPPPPALVPAGGPARSTPASAKPPAAPPAEVIPAGAQQPDPKPPAEVPPVLPPPKALPGQPGDPPAVESRLPGLAGPIGSTPRPSPETKARFAKFLDQIVDPETTLDLVTNRNRLLRFKEASARVQLGDDAVATMTIVTPAEISLTGRRVGTTILTLWFGDPKEPAKQEVLSYLIRVLPDPEYRERLERVYEALAGELNRAFPDSVVKLQLVGDKLVVSGQAKDIYEAVQILRVARANAPQGVPTASIPVGQINVVVPPEALAEGDAAAAATGEVGLANFLTAGGSNVVNLLRVGGEHQVMLKVTVAEVNRAAARSVGVNFDIARKDGLIVFANLTGNLFGNALGSGGGGGSTGGGLAGGGITGGITGQTAQLNNLPVLFSGGQVAAAVNALRTLNLARSLAEPNLTTLNGRPASFQAGGQFPVPVVTGFTSAGLQGVTYVPYGVSVNFTPVVTDDDRIRMTVNAEVSTRDASTSQTNIGGAAVPSLNNRSFQTTVELRAGETLAVAGLIQNNLGSDATRVPLLGDLPVVGRLFAFDRTSNADQELIILITPYLVHPLSKAERKPLPGAEFAPPTDCEFYLLGRLQNYAAAGAWAGPSAGTVDPALARRRRECEQRLLLGPSGYTDGK